MAAINKNLFVKFNEYGDGLFIDDYNGNWGLGVARMNQDGDVWATWAFPQTREDGRNVPGPKAFPIGSGRVVSRDALIARVEALLNKLKGGAAQSDYPQPEDDIPF